MNILRRRYSYCRFWHQSVRHSLWNALFNSEHYSEIKKDWVVYDENGRKEIR